MDNSEPTKPDEPSLPTAAATPVPTRKSRLWMLSGLAIVATASMLMLSVVMRSTATSSSASVASTVTAPGVSSSPQPPAGAPERTSGRNTSPRTAPRWTVTAPSYSPRTTAFTFALAAHDDIAVRKQRVRPVLTVTCTGKATEAFVLTHTAASFEGSSRQHTVALSFDGQPPVEEMWDHSVDHDALFAPDGEELARRIARAKTMTFTFTPFNGSPTTSEFTVKGLADQMTAPARKMCGSTLR